MIRRFLNNFIRIPSTTGPVPAFKFLNTNLVSLLAIHITHFVIETHTLQNKEIDSYLFVFILVERKPFKLNFQSKFCSSG